MDGCCLIGRAYSLALLTLWDGYGGEIDAKCRAFVLPCSRRHVMQIGLADVEMGGWIGRLRGYGTRDSDTAAVETSKVLVDLRPLGRLV